MADVHISPNRVYFTVFAALGVLTVATVWAAFRDFGWANDAVALGIATTKATVVVLFFMHVKYAPSVVKVVVISSFFWLLILFGLTVIDYATREHVVADPVPIDEPFDRPVLDE